MAAGRRAPGNRCGSERQGISCGPSLPILTRWTGRGPDPGTADSAPGRHDHRVAQSTDLLYATGRSRVLSQLPAIWLAAERRWIPRRAAVMHPPGRQASRNRRLECDLRCVSHDQRPARARYAVRIAADPDADRRHEGSGIRYRVRSVSRTGRGACAGQSPPVAALRPAFQRRA